MIPLGHVRELVRYPVKSMAGVVAESAVLGWHGLAGDRRFAFRRLDDRGGFPWLSASRLPELLLHHPFGLDESTGEPLPTHVRTPAGAEWELRSDELRSEIAGRLAGDVELMNLKHGIFDDAAVSVITTATVAGISHAMGCDLDRRRLRANVVIESHDARPFLEDGWVGGTLVFGTGKTSPAVCVTSRDIRCAMINLDPDTAEKNPGVLKAVATLNETNAGVYGTVVRTGTIRVGDAVFFVSDERR